MYLYYYIKQLNRLTYLNNFIFKDFPTLYLYISYILLTFNYYFLLLLLHNNIF